MNQSEFNRFRLKLRRVNLLYLIVIVFSFSFIPSEFISNLHNINQALSNTDKFYQLVHPTRFYTEPADTSMNRKFDSLKKLQEVTLFQIQRLNHLIERIQILSEGTTENGYMVKAASGSVLQAEIKNNGWGDSLLSILSDYNSELLPFIQNGLINKIEINGLFQTQPIRIKSVGTIPYLKYLFYEAPLAGSLSHLLRIRNNMNHILFISANKVYEENRLIAEKLKERLRIKALIQPKENTKQIQDSLTSNFFIIPDNLTMYAYRYQLLAQSKGPLDEYYLDYPEASVLLWKNGIYVKPNKEGLQQAHLYRKSKGNGKTKIKSFRISVKPEIPLQLDQSLFTGQPLADFRNLSVISQPFEAWTINSLRVTILSPKNTRSYNYNARYYSEPLRKALSNLHPKDKILLDQITAINSNGQSKTVNLYVYENN